MINKLSKSKLFLTTSFIAIFCNILWGTAFSILKIVYAEMGIVSSDLGGTIIFISLRFLLAGILIFGLFTKAPLFKITFLQFMLIIILSLILVNLNKGTE